MAKKFPKCKDSPLKIKISKSREVKQNKKKNKKQKMKKNIHNVVSKKILSFN